MTTRKRGGAKRRDIEESAQLEDPKTIAQICDRADNTRDSCLVALGFLSGRRIGELLGLKRGDVLVRAEEITFTTFNEKTYREKATGQYRIERQTSSGKTRYYEEIRITFPTVGPTGSVLSPYVLRHLESLNPEDHIFKSQRGEDHIKRNMAYKIIRKLEPTIWLHWLRHQRFTQVAQSYKDDILGFHDFTHHHRIETSLGYVRRVKGQERLRQI